MSAAPSPESKKITSTSVVTAEPQATELTAGNSGEAVVRLAIQKGYHVNANPPTYPYLKATELEIKPGEGVSVGKVTYPQPVTAKFEFAEQPLAVYEGTTQLKAELKAEKGAQPGNRSLSAVLRIQACDDQVCYPPGKIELQIPVTVK
jgi:DsbC/DsbD-like thiol-disulfide interchange protein